MNDNSSKLSYKLFLQREDAYYHLPYDNEMAFYEAVKNGDFERVKLHMKPLTTEGLGKLSSNPLRNIKYHLIITVTLITRFCIEGGMPTEAAYTLSDIYIQQIDICNDPESIFTLHQDIIYDYTSRMQKIKKQIGLSKVVIKTSDYIYNHLNEKITLDELSRNADVNKSYLCELFKKETGQTINNYILKLKIETAQKMLMDSNFSTIEISNYFSFSSHSHFISTFKKITGMTPNQFKKSNYRHFFESQKNDNFSKIN